MLALQKESTKMNRYHILGMQKGNYLPLDKMNALGQRW